jgi:hypothetical protein
VLANQAAVFPIIIIIIQARRARRTEKAHHASAQISSGASVPLIGPPSSSPTRTMTQKGSDAATNEA